MTREGVGLMWQRLWSRAWRGDKFAADYLMAIAHQQNPVTPEPRRAYMRHLQALKERLEPPGRTFADLGRAVGITAAAFARMVDKVEPSPFNPSIGFTPVPTEVRMWLLDGLAQDLLVRGDVLEETGAMRDYRRPSTTYSTD